MRCHTKSDFTEIYPFGHKTCNSEPFSFKIGGNCAYLQVVSCSSLVRFGLKQFLYLKMPELQLTVWFFVVWFSLVAVFLQLPQPDHQTLFASVKKRELDSDVDNSSEDACSLLSSSGSGMGR